jgi:hypothetical protein
MKPYHLKEVRTFLPPYQKILEDMLSVTRERSIELSHGVRGFIIGQRVIAPYSFQKSFIAKKDGHNIVLTFEKTDRMGVTHFLMPFEIPCEPLRFRHKNIFNDTFLFRVYNRVILCHSFPVRDNKGQYGLDAPDQFCPVFDRHGHLIGINSGVFCDKLLCIPIQELV